jgi:ferredoxin--NADP+ reductase
MPDQPPLRVAIIGAGPAGFYAAEHLQKQPRAVDVDMFDRLPTPFGLVRGGVAPDHQKIKSVTRVYDRIASHPRFRFFGNVEYGTDLALEDLTPHYHAVLIASGAPTDRPLGIPGEELPGSHTATAFVGWYNGHPDFRDLEFDLSREHVVVVGIGNVAVDVTRVLCRTVAELEATDIAPYALEALRHSRVKTVTVLGRRGPVQAAFTNPEVKELGEMPGADFIVRPEDLELDPASQRMLEAGEDRTPQKNLDTLRAVAARSPQGKPRRIVLRFCVSPVALEGEGRVERLRLVRNRLEDDGRGGARAVPTGVEETIPADLVFRSVGYRGLPLPGLPFDDRKCVIPNDAGRIAGSDGLTLPRLYVAGWIKRGPSGVIGTNKPCAVETVESLLVDVQEGRIGGTPLPAPGALPDLLASRGVRVVTYGDWRRLDAMERERGEALGRPRLKFTTVAEMLAALDAQEVTA